MEPSAGLQNENVTVRPQILWVEDDFLETFAEAIANLVSCTGIKRNSTNHKLTRAFPGYTQDYKRRCIRKQLKVGVACPYDLGTLFGTRIIFSLPVREHWREVVLPQSVKAAIASLIQQCSEQGIRSLAVPVFEGPPPGWIQEKLLTEIRSHPDCSIETLYLFREE